MKYEDQIYLTNWVIRMALLMRLRGAEIALICVAALSVVWGVK